MLRHENKNTENAETKPRDNSEIIWAYLEPVMVFCRAIRSLTKSDSSVSMKDQRFLANRNSYFDRFSFCFRSKESECGVQLLYRAHIRPRILILNNN